MVSRTMNMQSVMQVPMLKVMLMLSMISSFAQSLIITCLFALVLVPTMLLSQPLVLPASLIPVRHTNTASAAPTVSITFDQAMQNASMNASGFIIHGNMRGKRSGTVTPSTPSMTQGFGTKPALPNELLQVSVFNALSNPANTLNQRFVYQFRKASSAALGTFTPGTTPNVGTQPLSATCGDFDGDGDLDIAAANNNSNNVSVLLNGGAGTYSPAVNYAAGSEPVSIGSGDFDNDGDVDLAVLNTNSDNVSILRNNGAGTFAAAVNYGAGSGPVSISIGDLDGDGDLDIVVGNYNSNKIYVLLNSGTGTFGGAVNYNTSNQPAAVAIGDFDGDGDLDIATGSSNQDRVSILMNSGTGTFGGAVDYNVGNEPLSISVGDLDGDGDLDIATANNNGNNVSILRNNGAGTFASAVNYSVGTKARSIAIGDIDGDGDLDLATANENDNNLSVLRNSGTGTFAAAVNYSAGIKPQSILIGDVDGDGDSDIMTANKDDNDISILFNSGTPPMNVTNNASPFGIPPTAPTFNTMTAALGTNVDIPFSQTLNPATVNATNFRVHGMFTGLKAAAYSAAGATATVNPTADFRSGEQVWVSVTNAQSTGSANTRPFVMGFRTASGLTSGAFQATTAVPTTAPKRLVYGHFNADAFIDMAVAGTGGVELFTGAANGEFTSTGMIAGSGGTSYFALAIADMDNTGSLDIIGGYNDNTRTVRVFTNNGAGAFTPLTPLTGIGTAANNINDFAVADFDADGLMDIAAACAGSAANGNYAVLRNTGGGVLAVQQTASSLSIYGVDVGDIDSDGDIDIAYTRWSAGVIFTLINDGRGNFYAGQTLPVGAETRSVRFGDVNNDGKLDLVAVQANATSFLNIFLNSGTSYPLTPSQTVGCGAWATDVLLFDADADSFLDAVATESVGGRLVFFKNNSGTFAVPTPMYRLPNLLHLAAADIDNDSDIDLAATANNNSVRVLKYGNQPTVTIVAPPRNGNGSVNPNIAAVGAPVTVNFSTNITSGTFIVPPAQQLFQVHGTFTGSRTRAQGFAPNGTYSGGAATMTFTPLANFRPGELVSVSVTNASSNVTAPNNSVGIRTRPFVFDYRVAAGVGPAKFVQTSSPAAGMSPFSVVTGDFNGDGKLDLATANNGSNNVSILLNSGTGTYALGSSPAVGINPQSITAGDFDGDGDLDLAVANRGSNTVSILLNSGTGAYVLGSSPAVGTNPQSMTAGDFDGDGDLDLAVANNGSSNFSILLNTGTGVYAATTNYATGTSPFSIAAGDFDSDGDLDIVTASNGGSNVSVMLNTGTGAFGTAINYGVGRSVTVADLDGDGDLDLAVANNSSSHVSILLNTGAGTFAPEMNYTVTSPHSLTSGDFDGDGDIDLATVTNSGTTMGILLNTGAGAFAAVVNYTVGVNPQFATAGDFDGDGDLDIATANSGSNNVSIMFNQSISTTYYYQGGDAGLPANWNSLPWGSGSPASAFTSPATDFYVMGGGATTTASVNTSFTIGANVSLHVTTPSVLAVANGITLTNNGFLNVSGATLAGARLRLVGTGAMAGNSVTYSGTTATLEYAGTNAKTTNNTELPAPMPGSLIINNSGGVTLHANRDLNSGLTP